MLSYEDLAEWNATVESTVSLDYRGLEVHKCPAWTQGPVFLQQLSILEGIDLGKMERNTAEYLHTWIETSKLAFADREAYYCDPAHDEMSMELLLSKDYAASRRSLIGSTASIAMRAGD